MSSYFDAMSRSVAEAADHYDGDDGAFMEAIRDIEEQLYREVTIVTGDREFPDDLRQKILGAFAVQSVFQPGRLPANEHAHEYALSARYSRVIETVHDLFHDLARRRIETRFGRLSDSPSQIKALRDEHDMDPHDRAGEVSLGSTTDRR